MSRGRGMRKKEMGTQGSFWGTGLLEELARERLALACSGHKVAAFLNVPDGPRGASQGEECLGIQSEAHPPMCSGGLRVPTGML